MQVKRCRRFKKEATQKRTIYQTQEAWATRLFTPSVSNQSLLRTIHLDERDSLSSMRHASANVGVHQDRMDEVSRVIDEQIHWRIPLYEPTDI